jgi:DHA1 family bicyclomycin/chloramphenicol resistance-like MFS transporter
MATPRAIVRDLHTGAEATRLMALLMLVFSVSPILAPLTGSAIIAAFGWRGVFWAVTAAAGVGLFLAVTQLKETRAPELRQASSWSGALRSYRTLLTDPGFMGLALVSAFGISSFFVYLANSSFVLIGHYGLTPTQFSLCFALNAVAFIGTGQLAGRLTVRFGLAGVIRWAAPGSAAAMALLAVLIAAGSNGLVLMIALLFVGYAFLGLVLPTTSVLAMERHGAIAGAASAMLGSIQMAIGSCAMAATAFFAKDAPLPMAAGIAASSVVACVIAQIVLWPRGRVSQAP